MKELKEVSLKMSIEEVNIILQILQKTPLEYSVSHPIITKIAGQANEQIAARNEEMKQAENKEVEPLKKSN